MTGSHGIQLADFGPYIIWKLKILEVSEEYLCIDGHQE